MARAPVIQNLDAEQAVLGAILYDSTATLPVIGTLTPDDFTEPLHARIYAALIALSSASKLADLITVQPYFDDDAAYHDLGGSRYLGDLIDKAPATSAAASYADQLRAYSHRRNLAAIGDSLHLAATIGDIPAITAAEHDLAALRLATSPFSISALTLPDHTLIPPREWLYGRHLIRRYVSTTIAPGGLGKSSLVLAEAVAMATGRRLLGDRPDGPLRVFYWNGEDPLDEIHRRLAAIFMAHNVKNADIGDRLFVASGRDMPIQLAYVGREGVVLNETLIAQLIQQLKHHKIDVLAVDPFVSVHQVPENDNGAIDAVIKRGFARIAHEANLAVEIVHHVRKPGGGVSTETVVDDARGASALIGAVRSARVLNAMTKEEAESARVENRFQYFRVDNGKSNMAPRSDEAIWRHLLEMDLQNGVPPDYVTAVVEWQMPGLFAGVTGDMMADMRHAVSTSNARKDTQSPDWVGHILARAWGLDSTDKKERDRISKYIRKWLETGILKIEKRFDPSRREREFVVVGDVQ